METPVPSARSSKAANSSAEGGEVKVIARFRPLNKMELAKGGKCSTTIPSETEVNLTTGDGAAAHSFSFDKVFGTTSSQQEVYEAAAGPLLQNLFQGFNCSLFSYGQVSCFFKLRTI
jgi:kinesin family member 5